MPISVLIGACYIQYPLWCPHKELHTYKFLLSQRRREQNCQCLKPPYIYRSSSASVHGESLNMMIRENRFTMCDWLHVVSTKRAECTLYIPFSAQRACVGERGRKKVKSHGRTVTGWKTLHAPLSSFKSEKSSFGRGLLSMHKSRKKKKKKKRRVR